MTRTTTVNSGKTYAYSAGEEEKLLRYIVRDELGKDCERLLDEVLERAWSAGQDQNYKERNEREDLIEQAQTIKNHCEDAECEECCFYAEDRDVCTLCKRAGPSEWDIPELKTLKDVFLVKFPNAELDPDGKPRCCARELFGKEFIECGLAGAFVGGNSMREICVWCWNQGAPKEYQG